MSDEHVTAVKAASANTDLEIQEKLARQCFEKAVVLASAIIKRRPSDYKGYSIRGLAHMNMRDFEASIVDFVQAVDLRPEDRWLLIYLGLTRVACGMETDVQSDLRKAYKIAEEHDATALLFVVNTLLQAQDSARFYGPIRSLLERAIKSKVADEAVKSTSYAYLAYLSSQENDYPQTEANCTQAIDHGMSTLAMIFRWRAWARQNSDDNAGAETDYREAITLGEVTAANYLALGRVRLAQAKLDDAVDAFDSAIAISKEDANAYYYRGIAFAILKQWKSAIADYTEAVKLAPPNLTENLSLRGDARLQDRQFRGRSRGLHCGAQTWPETKMTLSLSMIQSFGVLGRAPAWRLCHRSQGRQGSDQA